MTVSAALYTLKYFRFEPSSVSLTLPNAVQRFLQFFFYFTPFIIKKLKHLFISVFSTRQFRSILNAFNQSLFGFPNFWCNVKMNTHHQ